MLAVKIKDSLMMRGALCDKLHGGRSHLLFALHQSSIDSLASYSMRIAICAYLTCIRRPRYGGPRRNIAMTFGMEQEVKVI